MDISVADQRILLLTDQVSAEEAEAKAWTKKLSSFGTINKFATFLSPPTDDEFELIYKEHRYQPFWHVVVKAKYVYERNSQYKVEVSGPEVKTVTYDKTDFQVADGVFHLPVLEHCLQEEQEEVFIDAVTGKDKPDLKSYLSVPSKDMTGQMDSIVAQKSIVVPPQSRVSAIMRSALAKMIKGIQADKILEETVRVECVDLCYHPMYAFQYRWKSKNKEAIVEIDALNGVTTTGDRLFKEYLGCMLDQEFLFDIGRDVAGMLIPGGGIAVKIAKRYVDSHKNKRS